MPLGAVFNSITLAIFVQRSTAMRARLQRPHRRLCSGAGL